MRFNLSQKYWLLFREYLKVSSLFNTYFIFMTATQPLIFEPGSEIRELCVNKKQYFRNFDRLDLIPYLEPMEYDTFVDFVVEDITANPEKVSLLL